MLTEKEQRLLDKLKHEVSISNLFIELLRAKADSESKEPLCLRIRTYTRNPAPSSPAQYPLCSPHKRYIELYNSKTDASLFKLNNFIDFGFKVIDYSLNEFFLLDEHYERGKTEAEMQIKFYNFISGFGYPDLVSRDHCILVEDGKPEELIRLEDFFPHHTKGRDK